MSEAQQKTLAQLLNEDEGDELCECPECGYSQSGEFRRCPKCKAWMSNPTIADWGQKLPIGIDSEGKLVRGFDLRPLNWNIERQINQQWGARRDRLNLAEYMGTILANTITKIGNQDITKFKFEKVLLILNRMYQADVFYMYAYLRLATLGKEMDLGEITCPSCRHKFPFVADLSTLEVGIVENPSDLITDVELKDGFDMNGDHKTKLKMKPPLWSMLGSGFPTSINDAEIFLAMVTNCVVEIEGMPDGTVLTEKEVSQFSKYDVEKCQGVMEGVFAGPRWEIEGQCPKCGESFYDLVDWTYDRFFAISSRSPRRKKRSKRSLL